MNHQGTYSKKNHCTPTEMTKIKKINTQESSQDLEQQGHPALQAANGNPLWGTGILSEI